MTHREKQILQLLRNDPLLPQQEIARQLNISRSAVAGHIMNLMQKGLIRGKGYILCPQEQVLVIGSVNMDICGYSHAELVYEDSNPGKVRCTPGGVGRNIAENIALLGKECHLISVVGTDLYGATLLEQAKKIGINVSRCHRLHDESTSAYFSLLDHQGEMCAAINDMGILDRLTPALLAQDKELIQHTGALVVDCNLTEEALSWIFNNAGSAPIFVDTVSACKAGKIRNWLSHIHTLKPNRIEAEILSGQKIESPADIISAANWFHQQGIQRIVISMGPEGVYYSDNELGNGWSKPFNVPVVNVTGAGDALMAGLVSCWFEDMPLPEAIRFAQGCAALTLQSELTNNPSLSVQHVQQFLESHP
ncbi:MAG: PfkB family carbohydrate kinase [Enterobacteriaceae bacterium]